jgi:CHAD domain-containing protein
MITLAYFHLRRQGAVLEREGLRLGETHTPKAVHEMRIATRKLRAALKAFKSLLPEPERTRLGVELRWLANALGGLRDLDVYAENLGASLSELPEPDRNRVRAHIDQLARRRELARNDAVRALASARYRELAARLQAFTSAAPSPAALRRWSGFLIRDGIDPYLRKSLRRVQKRARRLGPDAPAEALHALRIEGKKYRYLLEFFAPLYGRELEKPVKGVRKLHGVLGDHQDACLAEQLLREYATEACDRPHPPDTLLALGRLLGVYAAKAADVRCSFPKIWRRFEQAEPRFPIAD